MIKSLEIKNFKSIKQLKLDCRRINILIGEPNTGKSNILESLGIFSFGGHLNYNNFKNFVRFERISNLFYDDIVIEEPVLINADDLSFALQFREQLFRGEIRSKDNRLGLFQGGYGSFDKVSGQPGELSTFKYYKFLVQEGFPRPESDFLLPTSGTNLMSLILGHKDLRALANNIFSPFGLEPYLRPQENKIELLKRLEGVTVSYPYSLTSDTLQRVIFYLCAVLSNKDSIIVFEEPESHAFPYYTKYLAETITLDEKNNQYFISTHNPYLLRSILEKAPKEDIGVFITFFKDYQTKIKPLNDDEKEEIMEIDVFSNLDRFLEGR